MEKEINQEVIMEFKKRIRKQFMVSLIVIFVLLYINSDQFNSLITQIYKIDGMILILVAVCCLIFSLFNWRCPACNRYLGNSILPKYCKKCGVKLR